jgi:hypothetical protein
VVHILIWDKKKSQINEYSDNLTSVDIEMQLPFMELQLCLTNKFDECNRSGKL